ncbi:MAG: methyltransferase, TIGR04325 family [Nitrospirota bacterium]
MTTSHSAIREWVPEGVFRLVGPYLGLRIRFAGSFPNWPSALAHSSGYDTPEILQRVKAATLRAATIEGAFERDGVVLDHAVPPFPLLAALQRAAAVRGDGLNVLDFGGSLGSSYHQCRPFLTHLKGLKWIVVEQPEFVRCGKDVFENDVLKFTLSVDDAVRQGRPDVVLFSAVLQYLEQPTDLLRGVVDVAPTMIVVDRTPVIDLPESRIAVQQVPPRLGKASYPLWLFNRDELLAPTLGRYRVLAEFDALDGVMSYGLRRVEFKGFMLDKTNG